jgi:hypothetical protein
VFGSVDSIWKVDHRGADSTRISDASHAPSSFRQAKRIRLSTPSHSPPHDGQSSAQHSPPGSPGSRRPSSLRSLTANSVNLRTLSQSSIPLRAIVSPKPPSIDRRSTYHMRDPELPPPRRMSAQWTGGARKDEEIGRVFPLQGWAFMVGFLLFPMWWVAAAAPVEWGWVRRAVGTQNGKGVWSEEDLAAREVVEYDSMKFRKHLLARRGTDVYSASSCVYMAPAMSSHEYPWSVCLHPAHRPSCCSRSSVCLGCSIVPTVFPVMLELLDNHSFLAVFEVWFPCCASELFLSCVDLS